MPDVIDEMIRASNDSPLWQNLLTATSIRATGKTAQGTPVVLYAHTENSLSSPAGIVAAIRKGLVHGAGVLSIKEFRRLLKLSEHGATDKTGNRLVHIVDYNKLKSSISGFIPVSSALEHPQTIPFIGSNERARQYLARFKEVCGKEIVIRHSDDLKEDQPLGRLLFIGIYHGGGISGGSLRRDGRFVGVLVENLTDQIKRLTVQ